MRSCLTLPVALLFASPASGQDSVPVVPATSRVVTVTDGHHVKKNYWYVMPERSPDVYYVEIPMEPHRVTFTTDRGAVSFDTTFGSRHEFVIRLADGREARTQVRAEFRGLLSPKRIGPAAIDAGVDAIPFRLGDNDKIYFKARLNGGPPLDVQFDLGAGGSLIKKASVPKVAMHFDGTARLRNSDGDNEVPSSSSNLLEIGGLRWEKVPLLVADNMTEREDLLLGNALFQDRVVEIDYDHMRIAIHETMPALPAGWTELDLVLDGVVPFARGTLAVDGHARDGWFMLDTGAYRSILNSDRLSPASKMTRELRRMIGLAPEGPSLTIAGRTFADPNYSVRRYDGDATALGLLGNDVLKRFNLILDNRRGRVYLRPNRSQAAPFGNPEYYAVRAGTGGVVLAGTGLVWFVRRRVSGRSSASHRRR